MQDALDGYRNTELRRSTVTEEIEGGYGGGGGDMGRNRLYVCKDMFHTLQAHADAASRQLAACLKASTGSESGAGRDTGAGAEDDSHGALRRVDALDLT